MVVQSPPDPRTGLQISRELILKPGAARAVLRRTMHNMTVEYFSGTATGLFEQADPHYGEIWYDLGGKRTVGRSATTDGVLDAIYELAGIRPPQEGEPGHRGHPLAAEPTAAAALFYIVWPLAMLGLGLFLHKRRLT